MIVASDDVGDAHVVIVDHDGEHVGRVAVAAQQHEIVEVLVLPDHAALHLILDHGLAGQGRAEPDRRLDATWSFRRVAGRATSRHRAACALPRGPSRASPVSCSGRGVAAIGLAVGEQLPGDLAVARRRG